MKQIAGLWGARVLGLILVVAAVAKGVEPGAFAQQIQLEGLDFLFSARTIVLIALGLEVSLGMLLLLGFRQLAVLIPSGLLVGFFLFLTGRNYWLVLHGLRGDDTTCGCFGSLVERTAAEAFWQDLFLLTVPLALACWGRVRQRPGFAGVRIAAVALSAGALVVYAEVNPDLHFVEAAAAIAENSKGEGSGQRFFETSDYELLINGEKQTARIFHSEESVRLLIRRPDTSVATVIDPQSRTVHEFSAQSITPGPDGVLELPAEIAIGDGHEFSMGPDGISFRSGDKELLLRPSQERTK